MGKGDELLHSALSSFVFRISRTDGESSSQVLLREFGTSPGARRIVFPFVGKGMGEMTVGDGRLRVCTFSISALRNILLWFNQ